MKGKCKQQLTALFSAAALFAVSGISVCAAPATGVATVGGLCGHHAEHTAACLSGTVCGHEHTWDCYSQSAACIHVHNQNCYLPNGLLSCPHVCSQVNGCLTSALNCQHVHDDNCSYAQGTVCGYSCDACHASQQTVVTAPAVTNTWQGGQYYYGRGCHGGSHHRSGRHC